MSISSSEWYFYLIKNGNYTYAGVSPDPIRRLRQHNSEISGGAKSTTTRGSIGGWEHVCLIKGFKNKIQCMQFEWAFKNVPPKTVGGVENRINKLYKLLNYSQWTSKAPLANSIPLHIEWFISLPDNDNNSLPEYVTENKY